MGKEQSIFRRRKKASPPTPPREIEASAAAAGSANSMIVASGNTGNKVPPGKKKTAGAAKLWMRFDRTGQSELIECDKSFIIKRVSIPARDLRILGPVFSHSSSILGSYPLPLSYV